MKKALVAVVALTVVAAAAGCSKGQDNAVIAKVNRTNITATEFKKQLEDLSPQMQHAVATDPKARKEFLEDLVGIELILQEAKRQGLDKDAEFKKKMDEAKKEQEEMRKKLEQRAKDAARNELFNALLKKELMGKIQPPTDDEVKEYFNAHREDIRKAAGGKDISLKEAMQKGLKNYVFQMKQREAYLEFTKGLRAKANVQVDEKVLDTLAAGLQQPAQGGLQLQIPEKKDAKPQEKEKK